MKSSKRSTKIFKYATAAIFIFLAVTIVPIMTFHRETNLNPLPANYLKGVYHLHSTYSDGTGDIAEITAAANNLGLDFAILTDHGNPNRKSVQSTGWFGKTLLIGGSELSLSEGHLGAMGFSVPGYIFPPEAQESIDDIRRLKGFSFIAHPFDRKTPWTDWTVTGFRGIEVLSSYESALNASWLTLLAFPARYLFNSSYALLDTLEYPAQNLKKWDEINQNAMKLGIFALDAHGKLPVSDKTQLPFPSYESMFRILNVYVKIDREIVRDASVSAALILQAIKAGHFFNVIEAIAPANGFDAVFKTKTGMLAEMGDYSAETTGKIRLSLPFNFPTDIRILRNGKIFRETSKNLLDSLEFDIQAAGVYRIEIFASENRFSSLPWIVTNPFFIGTGEPAAGEKISAQTPVLKIDRNFFATECSTGSRCSLKALAGSAGARQSVQFEYSLASSPGQKDFWCAVSHRDNQNLSQYRGITFLVESDRPARFWLEIRTGLKDSETWFRKSFYTDSRSSNITMDFKKLKPYAGSGNVPDLTRVRSIFISINNQIALDNTSGSLLIRNAGFY